MSGKMIVNTVVASGLMLASLIGPSEMSTRLAQQETAQEKAQGTGSAVAIQSAMETKASAPRGRLPRYYSAVVDQEQRSKIYEIQREYQSQRERLEQQLAELKKRELDVIQGVLREPQKEMIEKLRSDAEAKRLARLESMKSKVAEPEATEADTSGSSSD